MMPIMREVLRTACGELQGLALGLQERARSMELPDDPTQDLTMNRALSLAFQYLGSSAVVTYLGRRGEVRWLTT